MIIRAFLFPPAHIIPKSASVHPHLFEKTFTNEDFVSGEVDIQHAGERQLGRILRDGSFNVNVTLGDEMLGIDLVRPHIDASKNPFMELASYITSDIEACDGTVEVRERPVIEWSNRHRCLILQMEACLPYLTAELIRTLMKDGWTPVNHTLVYETYGFDLPEVSESSHA